MTKLEKHRLDLEARAASKDPAVSAKAKKELVQFREHMKILEEVYTAQANAKKESTYKKPHPGSVNDPKSAFNIGIPLRIRKRAEEDPKLDPLPLPVPLVIDPRKEIAEKDDPQRLDQIIDQAVQKLERRENANGESLWYLPRRQTPFTGWKVSFWDNGQVNQLAYWKDGKPDGLDELWYDNGQKLSKLFRKDGKMEGPAHEWYTNGKLRSINIWKSDKLLTLVVWKPNGEKCLVTKIDKDGNGVRVNYKDDGTEESRTPIKDGKRVR